MQNSDIISGIYCIENMINNKKYIGQSKNINDRWYKHKNELNRSAHDNDYLQKSWNKYGEENFRFYILECCSVEELDKKENYYIDLHNTLNRDYGYNLKSGGQGYGVKALEYVGNKISKSLKKAYENEDLRQQRRDNALKQWANPEIKAKISGENNSMYGKHHTEETRKKMSEMKKGKPSPKQNMTPVYCIESDKPFTNATAAAKELGLKSASGILQVCYGNRKTAGGYHWKFFIGK